MESCISVGNSVHLFHNRGITKETVDTSTDIIITSTTRLFLEKADILHAPNCKVFIANAKRHTHHLANQSLKPDDPGKVDPVQKALDLWDTRAGRDGFYVDKERGRQSKHRLVE